MHPVIPIVGACVAFGALFSGRDAAYYERRGAQAWNEGHPIGVNPYKIGSWQHDSWAEGWFYAPIASGFGGTDAAYYRAQGQTAAERGMNRNPYKRGSWQHEAWDEGWYDGAAVVRKHLSQFGAARTPPKGSAGHRWQTKGYDRYSKQGYTAMHNAILQAGRRGDLHARSPHKKGSWQARYWNDGAWARYSDYLGPKDMFEKGSLTPQELRRLAAQRAAHGRI